MNAYSDLLEQSRTDLGLSPRSSQWMLIFQNSCVAFLGGRGLLFLYRFGSESSYCVDFPREPSCWPQGKPVIWVSLSRIPTEGFIQFNFQGFCCCCCSSVYKWYFTFFLSVLKWIILSLGDCPWYKTLSVFTKGKKWIFSYCGISSLNNYWESVSWHLLVSLKTFYELLFKGCIITGYIKCICMR